MRLRAIGYALWFGVRPWWLYEPVKHYECGYWEHLWRNLCVAGRWATFREMAVDREFEREVNCNG